MGGLIRWIRRRFFMCLRYEVVHLLPGTYLMIVDKGVVPLEALAAFERQMRLKGVSFTFLRVSDVEKVKVVRFEEGA